jgi:hypothetical protein
MIAQVETQFHGKNNILDPLWYEKIGADYLGSGAAGIAQTGLAAAAFINPAGISYRSLSCYLESSWREQSILLRDFINERSLMPPSFVSIGVPLTIGVLQFGYARPYYYKTLLPNLPITTPEYPDGTGEFFTYLMEGEIHTGFVGVSITPQQNYSLGFSLGLDYVHKRSSFVSTTIDIKGIRFRSVVGLIARPSETVNAGIAIRFTTAKELELNDNSYDVNRYYNYVPKYEARSPLEVELGGTVYATPRLSFMVSAQLEDWSNTITGSHTICQFHLGGEFQVFSSTVIRAGYFTQYSPLSETTDYYDERFITLGFTISLTHKLQCSLSLITSKLLEQSVNVLLVNQSDASFSRSELIGGLGFSF